MDIKKIVLVFCVAIAFDLVNGAAYRKSYLNLSEFWNNYSEDKKVNIDIINHIKKKLKKKIILTFIKKKNQDRVNCDIIWWTKFDWNFQTPTAKKFPRCRAGDNECLPAVISEVLKKVKDGNAEMNLPPSKCKLKVEFIQLSIFSICVRNLLKFSICFKIWSFSFFFFLHNEILHL